MCVWVYAYGCLLYVCVCGYTHMGLGAGGGQRRQSLNDRIIAMYHLVLLKSWKVKSWGLLESEVYGFVYFETASLCIALALPELSM